jgi:PEP-CTERM motif
MKAMDRTGEICELAPLSEMEAPREIIPQLSLALANRDFNTLDRLKPNHMKFTSSSVLTSLTSIAAVALTFIPASINAALVQTNFSNPDQQFYASDVGNSDLINGLTPTVATGWNTGNGANPSKLNDGVHGANGVPVNGAWTFVGATITYDLGVGSGFGYDLSSIQSIASWEGDAYGNQAYTVTIQLVGSSSFTTLATVNNTPFTPGTPTAAGSTKTTLTDSSGILASGVQFIRFTATSAGASSGGATVYREIDVNGVAAVPEPASLGLFGLGALCILRRRRSH